MVWTDTCWHRKLEIGYWCCCGLERFVGQMFPRQTRCFSDLLLTIKSQGHGLGSMNSSCDCVSGSRFLPTCLTSYRFHALMMYLNLQRVIALLWLVRHLPYLPSWYQLLHCCHHSPHTIQITAGPVRFFAFVDSNLVIKNNIVIKSSYSFSHLLDHDYVIWSNWHLTIGQINYYYCCCSLFYFIGLNQIQLYSISWT